MKVLWLCNTMLPVIAAELGMEASNKEGWVSGMMEALLEKQYENGVALSVACPLSWENMPQNQDILSGRTPSFSYYVFAEDVNHAEKYEEVLEPILKKIVDKAEPDIVHCFGTEYPHTLAMCRIYPKKDRLLIGLQGLCTYCAESYYADLPEKVIHSVTLRDYLRRDSLKQQQEKFVLRGDTEREIIRLVGNITGRTEWDRESTKKWNPNVRYYHMNETLRPEFYGKTWDAGKCIPHSIFVSQGDYPLKGLHYMLCAMPDILDKYPDAKVYVAGNSLVSYKTLKQKLKISAYGKYLRRLLKQNAIEERVIFLGKLNAVQMRDRYLESSLFVCPSSLENSPNSLGEAMLLGMPCVSANVGGIPSIFTGGVDGIAYEGFRMPGAGNTPREIDGNRKMARNAGSHVEGGLEAVSKHLAGAVIEMWSNLDKMREYCRNARKHAEATHNREQNSRRLLEIYGEILS